MRKFALKGNRTVAREEPREGFKGKRAELFSTDGKWASGEYNE